MSRLLDLVFLRVQTFGNERFPYIVWWVCNIDLYALLSGIGRGEFLAAVIESHMLPGPESQLYPVTPDGRSVIYSNEQNILPAVLQLHHETFILATRLGFLASEFRHGNDSMSPNGFPHNSTKLYALRDRFKSLWGSSTAEYLVQQMNQLPQRPREMMQNVRNLPSSVLSPRTLPLTEVFRHLVSLAVSCMPNFQCRQHVARAMSDNRASNR